jgi:hypothetical protein
VAAGVPFVLLSLYSSDIIISCIHSALLTSLNLSFSSSGLGSPPKANRPIIYIQNALVSPYHKYIDKESEVYIYESDKGDKKISLVELPNYFLDTKTLWEIYCLKGQIFQDIERFSSKEEAEERIKELLD